MHHSGEIQKAASISDWTTLASNIRLGNWELGMAMRMQEYADADENLIHIIHINICQSWQVFGPKWVSLALLSILSAQNIIIVHTSWFHPSAGMKIKSPKLQNFGQEKMIFFYY